MSDGVDWETLCGEGGGGDAATCELYAVSEKHCGFVRVPMDTAISPRTSDERGVSSRSC